MGVVAQCFIYIVQLLFSMIMMDKIVNIKIALFSREVLFPAFMVFVVSLLLSYAVKHVGVILNVHFLFLIVITMTITSGVSLLIGANRTQRIYIYNIVKNKIKR